MQIKSFSFSQEGRNLVLNEAKGRDWPVVYLIFKMVACRFGIDRYIKRNVVVYGGNICQKILDVYFIVILFHF